MGKTARQRPVYRLVSSEDLTFGPTRRHRLPWMIAGLGVDVRSLIPATVAAGRPVRIGPEDAPLGTGMTNLDCVRAADLIAGVGGRLATPAEVRAATGESA